WSSCSRPSCGAGRLAPTPAGCSSACRWRPPRRSRTWSATARRAASARSGWRCRSVERCGGPRSSPTPPAGSMCCRSSGRSARRRTGSWGPWPRCGCGCSNPTP
ncbi:MAG: hypothetical protein AVDCRST_MAG61-659, partial [uncultured Friedmanniella sp.]